jgi:hypothetical protein
MFFSLRNYTHLVKKKKKKLLKRLQDMFDLFQPIQ